MEFLLENSLILQLISWKSNALTDRAYQLLIIGYKAISDCKHNWLFSAPWRAEHYLAYLISLAMYTLCNISHYKRCPITQLLISTFSLKAFKHLVAMGYLGIDHNTSLFLVFVWRTIYQRKDAWQLPLTSSDRFIGQYALNKFYLHTCYSCMIHYFLSIAYWRHIS